MTTASSPAALAIAAIPDDEFDLDLRIEVNLESHPVEAGFSNWATCKNCNRTLWPGCSLRLC